MGDANQAIPLMEDVITEEGEGAARMFATDLYSRLDPDPRYQAFLRKYGVAKQQWAQVDFDPKYPLAMQKELERYRKARQ